MDITRFNQEVALADFAREVERCAFYAIDQEMTGIEVPGVSLDHASPLDDIYRARRRAVEAYNAFQMGIALFTKTDGNSYEVRPYNFYLLNTSGDLRLCLSTVPFHIANHIDFQTWLTTGIPYCDKHKEEEYEKCSPVNFTDEDQNRLLQEFTTAIDEWLSSKGQHLEKEVFCTCEFARQLHNYIDQHYDHEIRTTYQGKPYFGQKTKFKFVKLDEEEFARENKTRQIQGNRDRARKLGFRQFWKILTESKKPIVGHNFLIDIMFMMHMHESPLPESYTEFKEAVRQAFPSIYDTKTMAFELTGERAFPVTHLGVVYRECRRRSALSSEEFSQKYRLPPGFYDYSDKAIEIQDKAHEAAYDAYMTGVAFTLMLELYPDAFSAVKNIISVYGSIYYCCIDGNDRLSMPSTYILDCASPCYLEEIEALFFASEPPSTSSVVNAKIDLKKLSYMVGKMDLKTGREKCTSFCVRMRSCTEIDELNSRLQSLRTVDLPDSINVNLDLLSEISIRNF